MAGLSRSFLEDSEFRQAFHESNPVSAVRTDSLLTRLSEFLRVGLDRNKRIRGATPVTRLVEALLSPEEEEFSDEQLRLQP